MRGENDIELQLREMKLNYPFLSDQSIDLIISSLIEENDFMPTSKFYRWLELLNKEIIFEVEFIGLNKLNNWYFDEKKNLRHISKKFFSIEGIKVEMEFNGEARKSWDQPIINQPEIGFLGILCQKKMGILYFLIQAKIEPGNINKIQVSPTLQATKSNFTLIHGGKTPPFLEYFNTNSKFIRIIVDQLQSEQGARFLKKRNRNMIVEVDEDYIIEAIPHNYCWLTLGQIKNLMKKENLVNMDTRTVLSCIQL